MALNSNLHDMEKYELKWLRVLDCVGGLEFKSYVCQLCVFFYFKYMLIMLGNNISIELY